MLRFMFSVAVLKHLRNKKIHKTLKNHPPNCLNTYTVVSVITTSSTFKGIVSIITIYLNLLRNYKLTFYHRGPY